jgi:SAM-dependent MidA family methyltransferase
MNFLIELGILGELETLVPAGSVESIQRLAAIKKLFLPGGMGERFKVLVQRVSGEIR